MQRISVANAKPGMEIGTNVFSSTGLLLLAEGTLLTPGYIRRLKDLGIISIYIHTPFFDDVEVPMILSDETRMQAIQSVKSVFEDLRVKNRLILERCETVVRGIVDEVIANRQALVHLSDIRTHDNYTFGHSVNVCVLSVLIGISMEYSVDKLRDLALGALLHDVGKMMIPSKILNKTGKLTFEEIEIVRKHPEYGFELMRSNRNLSILSAHVAFQHHERYDGSGYPRALMGEEIHEFARVVAIADVYDALNCDRPYRSGLMPHEIIDIFMDANSQFDNNILSLFLKNVAIYPVGTVVRLTTGELAIVVKVLPGQERRPMVRLAVDPEGKVYENSIEIDLAEATSLSIQEVLKEDEVFQVNSQFIAI